MIGKQDRAAVHQGFADAVQANIFCVEPVPHPSISFWINSNCLAGMSDISEILSDFFAVASIYRTLLVQYPARGWAANAASVSNFR